MNADPERAEIIKAKNTATKIIKDSEERRKWIIDQADIHAEEEIKRHNQRLREEYGSKIYDISPLEKDLQEHKKNDIEIVKGEYQKNEAEIVDFLIAHITNVKIEIQRNVLEEYKEKEKEKQSS